MRQCHFIAILGEMSFGGNVSVGNDVAPKICLTDLQCSGRRRTDSGRTFPERFARQLFDKKFEGCRPFERGLTVVLCSAPANHRREIKNGLQFYDI